MQQAGETTSIPKVDPSKTMGFNHLQLMAFGLVNTPEQGKLSASRIEDGILTRNREKASDFCPMI